MLAALEKMTDANQREMLMLAGLLLSMFSTKDSKAGLERLGCDAFHDKNVRKTHRMSNPMKQQKWK